LKNRANFLLPHNAIQEYIARNMVEPSLGNETGDE
jgi:hypothetical protein